MADLDMDTAEKAYEAFSEQDSSLDSWTAEVVSETDAPAPEQPGDGQEKTVGETRTVEEVPVRKADTAKLTREQAKELTMPDYDTFDDVVDSDGICPDRLAEYTSVIPFFYTSFRSKKEKMGTLPKYPRFLALFGVDDPAEISMADVLKHFSPGMYESYMEADSDADCLAKSAGEIIARNGFDFSRKLGEEDYRILERNGVKDPGKYLTVADVTGISAETMAYDKDSGVVYNSDYEAAMGEMFGSSCAAGSESVVSLDELFSGLDPKVLKGIIGKDVSDIHETEPEYDDEGDGEDPSPFIPFDK